MRARATSRTAGKDQIRSAREKPEAGRADGLRVGDAAGVGRAGFSGTDPYGATVVAAIGWGTRSLSDCADEVAIAGCWHR
jgi:hypothetical protein